MTECVHVNNLSQTKKKSQFHQRHCLMWDRCLIEKFERKRTVHLHAICTDVDLSSSMGVWFRLAQDLVVTTAAGNRRQVAWCSTLGVVPFVRNKVPLAKSSVAFAENVGKQNGLYKPDLQGQQQNILWHFCTFRGAMKAQCFCPAR